MDEKNTIIYSKSKLRYRIKSNVFESENGSVASLYISKDEYNNSKFLVLRFIHMIVDKNGNTFISRGGLLALVPWHVLKHHLSVNYDINPKTIHKRIRKLSKLVSDTLLPMYSLKAIKDDYTWSNFT